jgi:hypothetical protein
MNEQQIDDIKNALREMMQIIIQRGDPLSDELKLRIAQVMEHVAGRIQQLRQDQGTEGTITEDPTVPSEGISPTSPTGEGQQPTGGEVPDLERAPHESSNINAFKYMPESKQLYIKFMGKDSADSGPVYSYQNVEKNIFDIIARGGVGPLTSGKNKYHEWHKGVTPSHGASVSALLKKGGYNYQRVS